MTRTHIINCFNLLTRLEGSYSYSLNLLDYLDNIGDVHNIIKYKRLKVPYIGVSGTYKDKKKKKKLNILIQFKNEINIMHDDINIKDFIKICEKYFIFKPEVVLEKDIAANIHLKKFMADNEFFLKQLDRSQKLERLMK